MTSLADAAPGEDSGTSRDPPATATVARVSTSLLRTGSGEVDIDRADVSAASEASETTARESSVGGDSTLMSQLNTSKSNRGSPQRRKEGLPSLGSADYL